MKSNINIQHCAILCRVLGAGLVSGYSPHASHQPRPVLAPHSPAGDHSSRGGMAAGDNCISIELLVGNVGTVGTVGISVLHPPVSNISDHSLLCISPVSQGN